MSSYIWYNRGIEWGKTSVFLRTAQVHLPSGVGQPTLLNTQRRYHVTDWKLVRMHYEVLGETVQELAKSHNISSNLINAALKSEQWERHPIVKSVKHWTKSNRDEEGFQDDIKSKADIMALLRAANRSPDLFRVESILLSKIESICGEIKDDDPDASRQMKNLVECIKELQPVPVKGDGGDTGGVEIKILNHFGDTPRLGCDVTPAIQIGLD